jgi:carboxypeptidase Q
MFRQKNISVILLVALVLPGFALGQPAGAQTGAKTDDAIAKIKDEGMNRSQAMKTIRYLTDVIGPRLTNSPNQRRASQWTKEQLAKWGLQNAAVDPWGEFGRGWELKRFAASFSTPTEYSVFRAYPKAWSPSTPGAVTGDVIYVDATDEAGLEKYKGKLKGAIILQVPPRNIEPGFKPSATRNDEKTLTDLENAQAQQQQFQPNAQQLAAQQFAARKFRFYVEEGAAVLIDHGFGVDAGTIRVMGAAVPTQAGANGNPFAAVPVFAKNAPATVPQIAAEVEQYNRIFRLVQQGVPVKMTVELDAKFYDDNLQGYNTIAELPGTDLKDEVVMIGAHLDSWHAGTGATDNGAGVTVVMEAMRILQAAGLKPRRTIRVALWTGEEQGLLGSRGYVAKNLAVIGDGSAAATFSALAGARQPINKKPAYDKFAAYYNLDNGTGQIRGIYMQGNEQLRPIFREWLAPFKEYNASTVTINSTGGTDHLPFDAAGLPGFQFIQDPVEYSTRTWHTTQDVADRILEDDLKKSAIIMAAFAYNSAMTDQKLPRKEAAATVVASILRGFDFQSYKEEMAFREAGLNHSVCGHEIASDEIPVGFPSILTVGARSDHHAHGE